MALHSKKRGHLDKKQKQAAEREELVNLRRQLASDKAEGRKRNDVAFWRERLLSQRYPDMNDGYDADSHKYGRGAGLLQSVNSRLEVLRIQTELARAQKAYLEGKGPSPASMLEDGWDGQPAPAQPVKEPSTRGVVASDAEDAEAARRRLAEKFHKD